MKAVVLSGGNGTRLRPITFSMAKQLIPVANKPVLFYCLEDIHAAGIADVVIVISPQTGDQIRAAVGDGSKLGLNVDYVVQQQPGGLAHALKVALPRVGDHDVIMYLGDNLLEDGVAGPVADFRRHRPNAEILITTVDDPSSFGIAEVADDGGIVRLVEKPLDPPSNLALIGVYLFDRSIREAINATRPSARGELEITDSIQHLIETGRDVRASTVTGWWKDTGRKDDLLAANALVMAGLVGKTEADLTDTTVRGEVQVASGAVVVDSVLTGPVVIGTGVEVIRSAIGPNVAIASGARVSDAQIHSSIVMDRADVHGWKLHNSLVGRGSLLRAPAPDQSMEVTLGEQSEIGG